MMIVVLGAGCSSGSSSTAENLPEVPSVKLNSGYTMPVFGLGTWTQNDSTAAESVYTAIRAGYRLIDTARY